MGKFQKQLLVNQKKRTTANQELSYFKQMLKAFEENQDFNELEKRLENIPNFHVPETLVDIQTQKTQTVENQRKKEYLQYLKKNHKKGIMNP